jgi:hypothetical protein
MTKSTVNCLWTKSKLFKNKRKNSLYQNNSNNDLRQSSRFTFGDYSYREQQQIFNENHKGAIARAKSKREEMDIQDYRYKLFISNRRSIESNIQIELRAIKIVRLWQEKRKARFIKLISINKVMTSLGQQYNTQRDKWLKYMNQHLMVYRVQKAWKKLMSHKGNSDLERNKKFIKSNFEFISNMHHITGVEQKSKFIM